jgi:hypothetical protein
MNTRTTLALAAAAGLPLAAQAQEVFQAVYSWQEVIANTTAPVALPNSVVEPGEGARIRIQANALINGTSAIGQTSSYTNPAPGGVGTIKGLGIVQWDLIGDDNATTANGVWASLLGPESPPFNSNLSAGTVQPGGSSIFGFGGAQFRVPGTTANGANNVQVMRSVWTPAGYSPRAVNFVVRENAAGLGTSALLCYGHSTFIDIGAQEIGTYDLLVYRDFSISSGQGLNIPIAPTPSSLSLLGLAALVGRGRRHASLAPSGRD